MKYFLLLFAAMMVSFLIYAQIPQSFNYQAIVRNQSGEIISNQDVTFRVSVVQGSVNGTTIYSEQHSTTTNGNGLAVLQIGQGNPINGDFVDIDWAAGSFFLKIELDEEGGSDFKEMGTSQLLSVPYALHAKSVANIDDADADPQNELQNLSFSGNNLTITEGNSVVLPYDSSYWKLKGKDIIYKNGNVGVGSESPGSRLEVRADTASTEQDTLFSVKDKNGNVVFAVFPDGARVYVDNTTKGRVGGFAVSGRSATKANEFDLMKVTPDSTRIYVPDAPAKGRVGSFAVSGRSATKGTTDDIFWATKDSTRIYISEPAKRRVGGFAVSGRSATKASTQKFLDLTPDNYFIGHESGSNITTGLYNSFFGYQAGLSNTEGSNNVFLGYLAGYSNLGANNNVFIGNESGYNITSGYGNVYVGYESGRNDQSSYFNSLIGYQTGINNTGNYNAFFGYQSGANNEGNYNSFYGPYAGYNNQGDYNAFLGYYSGYSNLTGNNNVFLGYRAGRGNTYGHANVLIGYQSGFNNAGADYNTFIGYQSGYTNNSGSENVFLGYNAGFSNTEGFRSVFIGYKAGEANTTGDYNIFIGRESGLVNDVGSSNIYIGEGSGSDLTNGEINTFVGKGTGSNQTSGNYNVYLGGQAGIYKTSGDHNVYLGYHSGARATGDNSVLIGYQAGMNSTVGSGNVLIGYRAGSNLSGSNRLIIENSAADYTDALIYGEFDNDKLQFNGTIGINRTPGTTYGLYVDGGSSSSYSMIVYKGAYAYGSGFVSSSDVRYKKDIATLKNPLNVINKLRGVSYKWRKEKYPEKKFDDSKHVGFIAQEVEEILPEVVTTDEEGYKGVNYSKMTSVLVEAMKEQQKMIEKQNKMIEDLQNRIEKLENK